MAKQKANLSNISNTLFLFNPQINTRKIATRDKNTIIRAGYNS